jgi:outer membrane protein TolC
MHLILAKTATVIAWVALIPFIWTSKLHASALLTEAELLKLQRADSNPSVLELKAGLLQAELATSANNEMFGPRMVGGISRGRSSEIASSPMMPVLSESQSVRLGVLQKMPSGVSIEAGLFGSQNDAAGGMFTDATEVGGRVVARFDLWKNFLGSLDQAQTMSADLRFKRAQLENKIAHREIETATRKLWWSAMATLMSLDLARELTKNAREQLSETRAKVQAGVADRGDEARQMSQVASRNSSVLLYEYELEKLLEAVSRQVPGFVQSNWKIEASGASQSEPLVMECLAGIQSMQQADPGATLVPQILKFLESELEAEKTQASEHDRATVALTGALQTTGVGSSWGDASSTLRDDKRTGVTIGVEFSKPLGDTSHRTSELLKVAKTSALTAQMTRIRENISTTHDSAKRSLQLLMRGLEAQRSTSASLSESIKSSKTKFNQGRIPFASLLQEQDALFQARLQEIVMRKQIAFALLDYLNVFTEFPCSWNKL